MPVNSPNTDKLLVTEFEKGNKKAFRKLFELFWEPMYSNAKSIVLDGDIAKDIVQNIWTNIWQHRETRKIQNFEGYIYKVVRYNCYKYLRNNRFRSTHIAIIDTLQLGVEPEIEKLQDLEETQIVIQNSLDKLSPRCRQIFTLSRLEDTSNEEIAASLGISKRSVENQISIALNSIRHNMLTIQSVVTTFFIFLFF